MDTAISKHTQSAPLALKLPSPAEHEQAHIGNYCSCHPFRTYVANLLMILFLKKSFLFFGRKAHNIECSDRVSSYQPVISEVLAVSWESRLTD